MARLSKKQYARVLAANKDHLRHLVDVIKNIFNKTKWHEIDYPPKNVELQTTLRIYRCKESDKQFVKLGNHTSYTAGYWFEQKHEKYKPKTRELCGDLGCKDCYPPVGAFDPRNSSY